MREELMRAGVRMSLVTSGLKYRPRGSCHMRGCMSQNRTRDRILATQTELRVSVRATVPGSGWHSYIPGLLRHNLSHCSRWQYVSKAAVPGRRTLELESNVLLAAVHSRGAVVLLRATVDESWRRREPQGVDMWVFAYLTSKWTSNRAALVRGHDCSHRDIHTCDAYESS